MCGAILACRCCQSWYFQIEHVARCIYKAPQMSIATIHSSHRTTIGTSSNLWCRWNGETNNKRTYNEQIKQVIGENSFEQVIGESSFATKEKIVAERCERRVWTWWYAFDTRVRSCVRLYLVCTYLCKMFLPANIGPRFNARDIGYSIHSRWR